MNAKDHRNLMASFRAFPKLTEALESYPNYSETLVPKRDLEDALRMLQAFYEGAKSVQEAYSMEKWLHEKTKHENNALRKKLVEDPHRKLKEKIKRVVDYYYDLCKQAEHNGVTPMALASLEKPMMDLRSEL